MAPKGLRPGDCFEDAGRRYEVVAVLEDGNYRAREKPPEAPKPKRKAKA